MWEYKLKSELYESASESSIKKLFSYIFLRRLLCRATRSNTDEMQQKNLQKIRFIALYCGALLSTLANGN